MMLLIDTIDSKIVTSNMICSSDMGQIPQDGNFGRNVSLFLKKKRRAFMPICSLLICIEIRGDGVSVQINFLASLSEKGTAA